MKKANSKTAAPVNLGNKRTCVKCSTKFYDFNKEEIICPKCNQTMTAEEFVVVAPLKADPRRAKSSEKTAPEALVQMDLSPGDAPEPFESAEELADADDELADDVDASEDENDF